MTQGDRERAGQEQRWQRVARPVQRAEAGHPGAHQQHGHDAVQASGGAQHRRGQGRAQPPGAEVGAVRHRGAGGGGPAEIEEGCEKTLSELLSERRPWDIRSRAAACQLGARARGGATLRRGIEKNGRPEEEHPGEQDDAAEDSCHAV